MLPASGGTSFCIKMLMRDGERRRETDLLIQKRYAWRGWAVRWVWRTNPTS